jgi:hypothetical protein
MKTPLLAILALTAVLQAAEQKFGKALEGKPAVTLAELVAKPESYVGKEFQVKGKITEVCQAMGCWIMLTDGKADGKPAMLRYQADERVVTFPKNAAGRNATVEGKLAKYELTKEEALAEAKHAAADAGRKFDPSVVKGPQVIYQIEGERAVLD